MTGGRATAELIQAAHTVVIEVPRMRTSALIRAACDHYNSRNPEKRPVDPESIAASPEFVGRIMVNYLRHSTTRYDRNRNALRTLTTSPAVRNHVGGILKARTLAAIAAAYPQLAEEARRQAQRADHESRQR